MNRIIGFLLLFQCLTFAAWSQVEEAVPAVEELEVVEETPVEEVYEEAIAREPYIAPPVASVEKRPIGSDRWTDATKQLDYSKDVPEPPKPMRNTSAPNLNWGKDLEGLGTLLQVLAIIVAVILVGWGIFQAVNTPRNRLVARDGVEITLENMDEYVLETDLDRFLREALAAQNYPLAIRIYYLKTIRQYAEKGSIQWAKEKTNRDYLREMRQHHQSEQFKKATLIYERVWYGNQPVAADDFLRLEAIFKAVLG